ncbi:MAG: AmmeMemoRadiSam system radical SAM enzyme [Proteobacteria bacterium]|nr:AmmeMemoRadiSam system radical SAM enzyme [Pseudomonadota bacterium]
MPIQCELCPRLCTIKAGQAGDCRVRVNIDGKLRAVTYGYPVSVHIDPMEKKPLFHFLPGEPIFSVATVGCNLHCQHCQNWEISQANPDDVEAYDLPPENLAALAHSKGCRAVAYTYTEPLVYYEYTYDSSVACHKRGLKNVLVSAGYINPEPWRALCKVIDGAILDVKAMSDRIYRETCLGTLEPVLNTLRIAREEGVWVEVLNLLIPTINDSNGLIDDLAIFVRDELGVGVPLHFTAFHPDYKLRHIPRTPQKTLERARQRALQAGLHNVFVGNVMGSEGENTYCPGCDTVIIRRVGFKILENRLDGGSCPDCGTPIFGVWK